VSSSIPLLKLVKRYHTTVTAQLGYGVDRLPYIGTTSESMQLWSVMLLYLYRLNLNEPREVRKEAT
jgi:hypothetical protein